MLLDHVDHRLGQLVLEGEVDAVLDVALDDERGKRRITLVVGIDPFALVLGKVLRLGGLADIVKERADAAEQRVGADGVGGVLGQIGHDQAVVVGAGRFHLRAMQQRMVVIRQFQQGDVGGPLEEAFQHREQAGNGHAGKQAGGEAGGHLPEHDERRQLIGESDEQGEAGDAEPAEPGRAHNPAAAADGAARENADHRREEGDDEQVEAVAVDDAGEDRDQQRHEDRRAGVDEDGDDERRQRRRRHIGQEGRGGGILHEIGKLADPVSGAHQGQVQDDDQGQQGEAAVVAHRLRILEPDVKDGGHHHREHEEDAAEQLQAFVDGDVAVVEKEVAVGDQHLVLLRADARAGLDDRLAALDGNDRRPQVDDGLLLEALGGLAVENKVRCDPVVEEAKQCERGIAAHPLGGEVDPQKRQRLLHRLHPDLRDLARGAPHPEKSHAVGHPRGETAAAVIDALPVDFPQRRQSVFRDGEAGPGVAERQKGGDIVGGHAIGTFGVKSLHNGRELGGAAGRRRERPLHAGRRHGGGRIVPFELLQGGEQFAQIGFELLERSRLELVDRWHAVAELRAAQFGLQPALVGKGRARHDAHHRELVGEHRKGGRGHPDEADEHDGGHRGDKDQERHRRAASQVFRGNRGAHGLAPPPNGDGAAAEEPELLEERHGAGGGPRTGPSPRRGRR